MSQTSPSHGTEFKHSNMKIEKTELDTITLPAGFTGEVINNGNANVLVNGYPLPPNVRMVWKYDKNNVSAASYHFSDMSDMVWCVKYLNIN